MPPAKDCRLPVRTGIRFTPRANRLTAGANLSGPLEQWRAGSSDWRRRSSSQLPVNLSWGLPNSPAVHPMPTMTSPYRNNPEPRPKPKSAGGIPLWQLVVGGLFICVGSMLAGIAIAETIMALWMPEVLR